MAQLSAATESHMHDFDAHVRAVEEDFEYYRSKRLEPRVLFLARRGILTLYGLLRAVRRALIRAGLTTPAALESRRAEVAQPGPWNGARIVARAWVDPEFKRSLLEHGRAAVRELDIPPGRLGKLGVAENTETVH